MAKLRKRRLFDESLMTVARVVDQHIDRSDLGFDLRNYFRNGIFIGDVQNLRECRPGLELLELHASVLIANRPYDAMSRRDNFLRERASQPRAHSGYQPSFLCHV